VPQLTAELPALLVLCRRLQHQLLLQVADKLL
jgi:hypothetical protein